MKSSSATAQQANNLAGQLQGIPKDHDGPVFREPWEAKAFALTVMLHEKGAFSWSEWAEALSARIKEFEQCNGQDDGKHYYNHWLKALEDIITRKRVVSESALEQRRHDWREAAERTPHGQPIEL